ncbi:hypothetical protein IFM89_016052 [Coptis chinensis]|uniref:Uncharacterized protein n=1 Tax=Coptis chinensis TaxID=261450 RepID=A0A835HKC6_9MAGN|nr:hypothetical protein IFM89_016052 [Coptis chinensis]
MSPADVQYISTYRVRPLNSNKESGKIPLTPWDLTLLPVQYIQKGILFLKPQSRQTKEEQAFLVDQLKKSLAPTLDFFFPLAGRLAMEKHKDDSISFFIKCNDQGASLVHAPAEVLVSDILDPVYVPPVVYRFFPINYATNYDGLRLPLLSIQVTFLIDGIFIGCTMNHSVCDGSSFWHFMNSWSAVTRGKAGELVERGLGWAAWLLNQTITSHNDSEVRSSWEAWMKKPLLMTRSKAATGLITGSSPRFNVYENDFGWGKPIGVRSGCGNKSEGNISVYPGPVEGSVEIEACLLTNTLKAMGEDLEFSVYAKQLLFLFSFFFIKSIS